MVGSLLCRMGLHKWRRFNGRLYSVGRAGMVVYDRECRRCHLTQKDCQL